MNINFNVYAQYYDKVIHMVISKARKIAEKYLHKFQCTKIYLF